MWYSKLYRRHLLDMHIEDWHSDFLAEFSPEVYVENLKKAHINYAMVYLQSHVGLCNFPTKTGVMHKRVEQEPNLIKRVVDLCHQNGIKVCGYYSLIFNTREHDRHPSWRMKTAEGFSMREGNVNNTGLAFAGEGSRYGHCCPSNLEYRQFVYDQIDEMLAYFDCDALFFDMPFWPHTCYCESCRKAYGKAIPFEKNRELWEFKDRMMGEFIQSVTDHVKKRCPEMPVEHNYAQAIAGREQSGCGEEVLAACDYVGGDLYGDLYNHSFACKFYKNATRNAPFEQMFSRCKPSLKTHTLTKTLDEMKTAVSSTMAHHGATLVIDAVDPVGTMDPRVYEQVGKLFDFQQPYEPYFEGEMVEEVGLYYGLRSRLFADRPGSRCCVDASKTLIRAHIPFGVTGAFHSLEQYKILAAPMLSEMEDKDNARLIHYVKNGGTLYLSGCGNHTLVKELTGNEYLGESETPHSYLAPAAGFEELFGGFTAKYPLPVDGNAPLVKPGEAEVLATLTLPYTMPGESRFASIHSNPPGVATSYPMVTVNRYGKGWVVWSALPLERGKQEEYRRIFLNLLQYPAAPQWFFTTDASSKVELTAFRQENTVRLNAVSMSEGAVSEPVAPFTVRVRGAAKSVCLLPGGEPISFTVEAGYTVFQTRTLDIFDMYELIF